MCPSLFLRNVRLTGGVTPTRSYVPELLPDVLSGAVEPGRSSTSAPRASRSRHIGGG